jgi:hypothetical protein
MDKLNLRIDAKLQKLVPALSRQQYRQLKEDIKARGQVLEPLDVTDSGVILDSHNRWAIIQELKIEGVKISYDVRTLEFGTDHVTAVPSFVRAVNLHRRHLTTEQKRKLIREELKANPTDSNRKIAELLGVDDKTIAASRKQTESTAEIPQSEARKGADGKTRRTPPPRAKRPNAEPKADDAAEPGKADEAPADIRQDEAIDTDLTRERVNRPRPQEIEAHKSGVEPEIESAAGNGHGDGVETAHDQDARMIAATRSFLVAVREYEIECGRSIDMPHGIVNAAKEWLNMSAEQLGWHPRQFTDWLDGQATVETKGVTLN